MNNNLTDITFLIDRSGSMSGKEQDVVGGLKSFIKEQRQQEGEANLTVYQFDHIFEKLLDTTDINKIDDEVIVNYKPRGATALYDSLGRSINLTGARLSALPENQRPGKVLFVVITDGYENASKEFNSQKIKEMIQHQENKYSWEFIYLGADHDAFLASSDLGFTFDKTMVFDKNKLGQTYSALNKVTTQYRTSGVVAFNDQDRKSVK